MNKKTELRQVKSDLYDLVMKHYPKLNGNSTKVYLKIALNAKDIEKVKKTIDSINESLNVHINDNKKITFKENKEKIIKKPEQNNDVEPKQQINKASKKINISEKDKNRKEAADRKRYNLKDVDFKKYDKLDLNCDVNILLFTTNKNDGTRDKKQRSHKRINGSNIIKYYQVKDSLYTVNDAIIRYSQQYIYGEVSVTEDQQEIFNDLINILIHDRDFKDYYGIKKDYIHCIYILKCDTSDEGKMTINKPFLNTLLYDDNFNSFVNNMVFSKYIDAFINKDANNFNELFREKTIQYVAINYKNNSCFINCIINCFKNAFDAKNRDGSRKYKELTYDHLLNILDIKNNREDNIGISIQRVINSFFIKYRLGLDVVNENNTLIHSHIPDNINNNISPNHMRIMITNDHHIILLNDNINSFDQVKKPIRYDVNNFDNESVKQNLLSNDDLIVSDDFYIINRNKEAEIEDNFKEDEININTIQIMQNLDDLVKIIKNIKSSDETELYINVIYNERLENLVIDMYSSYKPKISLGNGNVKDIKIKVDEKKIITIQNVNITTANDSNFGINNLDTLRKYFETFNNFYDNIFKREYLQFQHENTLMIDNYYSNSAISGYLNDYDKNKSYDGIDIRKCYTYCMQLIRFIGIFDYFDVYKRYNGEGLEPFNKYIIELLSQDELSCIMFPGNNIYNRCYGFKLIVLSNIIKFRIIYVQKPSSIIEVDFKKHIDDVYNTKIDNDNDVDLSLKKQLINVPTGILEKRYNKKSKVSLFKNRSECQNAAKLYNGKVKTISKIVDVEEEEEINPLDIGLNVDVVKYTDANKKIKKNKIPTIEESVYACVIEKEKELTSNFRHIKDQIYDLSHLEILKAYNKLKENNINVVAIKTDCVLYENIKNVNIDDLFNFDNKIGCYKKETDKKAVSTPIMNRITNDILDIIDTIPIISTLQNEYDNTEFKEIYDKENTLTTADLPGSGKTTSIYNYDNDVLIICPFNKLVQENIKNGYDSITNNKLFDIKVTEELNKLTKNEYDISMYKTICFDEIYLYKPSQLKIIEKFIKKNSTKRILATGDTLQLKSFGFKHNNIENLELYIKECIDIMFPNQISLKINKRLKNEEDKIKLNNLKNDIFDPTKNKDMIALLRSYDFNIVESLYNINTKNNICYFNYRAKQVNKFVSENVDKTDETIVKYGGQRYYKGLNIICNKHKQLTDDRNKKFKMTLYKNHEYRIVNITKEKITISNDVEKKIITTSISSLDFFGLPFCGTAFMFQGMSIDDEITVFDIDTDYTDPNFAWVAITRARDLKKVNICITPERERQALSKSHLNIYFKDKIEGYLLQDKIANRKIDKNNYIDIEFINKLLEDNKTKRCPCCLTKLYIVNNEAKINSNISFDRVDNSVAHHKDNLKLLCVDCNKAKSNHNNIKITTTHNEETNKKEEIKTKKIKKKIIKQILSIYDITKPCCSNPSLSKTYKNNILCVNCYRLY